MSEQQPPAGTNVPEMWLHYDKEIEQVVLCEGEAPPPTRPSSLAPSRQASGDADALVSDFGRMPMHPGAGDGDAGPSSAVPTWTNPF